MLHLLLMLHLLIRIRRRLLIRKKTLRMKRTRNMNKKSNSINCCRRRRTQVDLVATLRFSRAREKE